MELRLVILILTTALTVNAFNIDLETKVVHKTAADSWFGYDIAFYVDDADKCWLLVGAPQDQSPRQVDIRHGGRVYRCSIDQPSCQSVAKFEQEGNARALNGSEMMDMESKSGQMLGATVSVSADGKKILACAPRYTYFYKKWDRNGPTGYCYLAQNNFADVTQISPGRKDSKWGQHRLGYSLFGFTGGFDENGQTLFLGGPGSYYWQGALATTAVDQPQNTIVTGMSDEKKDNRYMGFAMTTGDFDGDGFDDVAVSAPRDDFVTGMVSMYSKKLHPLHNITGVQVGSYFGYSLAAADLDNDGLVDLIIGEPFYVKYTVEKGVNKQLYEIGRVHVYYQGANHAFSESTFIEGTKQWSQFGLSVASAGDLNSDGFQDIVVGAPYDGENKRGAIYVFNGNGKGIDEEFSQVIYAEEVSSDMKSFGFSFATGHDIDRNEYPDIAVGAYASSNAVVLRSRPVVSITGTIKLNNPEIDLENKLCVDDGDNVACDEFELCLKYTGVQTASNIDVMIKVSFDASKDKKRSHNRGSGVSVVNVRKTLKKDNQLCEQYRFSVLNGIRDKLSPIVFEANYTLVEDGRESPRSILDARQPASIKGQVSIRNNCGNDKICHPDQSVKVTLADGPSLILGTEKKLHVNVTVSNKAEDAHEAQLFIRVPTGLEYDGIQDLDKVLTPTCSFKDEDTVNHEGEHIEVAGKLYMCDVGNPLPKDKTIKFQVRLDPKKIDASEKHVRIEFNVTSANEEPEESRADNVVIVDVPVEVSVQLRIRGKSTPDIVNYASADVREQVGLFDDEIGPLVTHLYELQNQGESTLLGAHLDIYWPSYSEAGNQLLYLIDKPHIQEDSQVRVECRIEQGLNVNPLSYYIDKSAIPMNTFRVKRQTGKRQAPAAFDPTIPTDWSFISMVTSSLRKVVEAIVVDGRDGMNDPSGTLNRANVNCDTMNCTHISCEVGEMQQDATVEIRVHSRLWIKTLVDEAFFDAQISSVAVAEVDSIPHATDFDIPLVTTAVTTKVNPTDPRIVKRPVPWWLYLIAVLAGLTLLTLLILLLWRCGFFKRNRPPASQALLEGPAGGEGTHFGFAGGQKYAPVSQYSESAHGARL